MRISDWSSDVCSSDLRPQARHRPRRGTHPARRRILLLQGTAGPGGAERFHREVAAQPPLLPRRARRRLARGACARAGGDDGTQSYGADAPLRLPAAARVRAEGFLTMPGILWLASYRSEEHTSELQSLMRTSYAVFCLKKKN